MGELAKPETDGLHGRGCQRGLKKPKPGDGLGWGGGSTAGRERPVSVIGGLMRPGWRVPTARPGWLEQRVWQARWVRRVWPERLAAPVRQEWARPVWAAQQAPQQGRRPALPFWRLPGLPSRLRRQTGNRS